MTERRLRGAVLVLSIGGAAIAAYLTVAHFSGVPLACATGGCERVQDSRYAEVAGIPLAVLGLVAYLVLAGTAAARGELGRAVGLAAALSGFAVAMVLLYVQIAELHAYCQWCLASDAILVALVPLTLLRVVRGDPPPAAPSPRARRQWGRAPAPRAGRAPLRRRAG